MLWEVDIYPAEGQPDRESSRLVSAAAELGLCGSLRATTATGFLLETELSREEVQRAAHELLADPIVQRTTVGRPTEGKLLAPPEGAPEQLVYVLLKPGVMDPTALSTKAALEEQGFPVEAVRTFRKYWIHTEDVDQLHKVGTKLLANEAIEQLVIGPLPVQKLELGSGYHFERRTVSIRELSDAALEKLSKSGQLYLSLTEMQTIQAHFRELGREPTDVELETVAQTWSEHCSHKTLAGRIRYVGPDGERAYKNMLKETIFAATQTIRKGLGADDWCLSVFKDNAGVVAFDDQYAVVFKVETHNHPSAIEPYGGANTGLGGVIRDPLGTGLGAKPVCSTDVFCFAPPDFPAEQLPPGTLHPKRVMQGVVSGVRDYGNRMGIPTVNGAIYFDPRYLGNPLVYCGNVGIIPLDKIEKTVHEGDYIVAMGGRTGRDGIHGATFSSAELTEESETVSGGAVQIGNAITEKMVMDVLLQARDRGLYHAVTDCGAGGFSSAVGEMGADLGAEVWLDKAPLKYSGLSYPEIWISEAQERMVLAVHPDRWVELSALCASEGVEATVIGVFQKTGDLVLMYDRCEVGRLSMHFLHDGRPPVVREARYEPPAETALVHPSREAWDFAADLHSILGSLNVCSKEWVIRQYDHEVQAGSVIKPLVGVAHDGPSDAAVVRPRLDSWRGLAISCGMNPRLGDFDPYHMAASAIDEAIRNCVAVGADPSRIAILDNFCWGNCDKPETLGTLVRAATACHDLAVALGTPFISGKDSLNNEFSWFDASGKKQTLAIPSSLLISAMGQVADARGCITMDLKEAGNKLYLVGLTRDELGGSHWAMIHGLDGGSVPKVDASLAKKTFFGIHAAIRGKLVRACHDLSEGGLGVAIAEMAFAGGLGAEIDLSRVPNTLAPQAAAGAPHPLADVPQATATLLFSESNSRFLCEVRPENAAAFEAALAGVPHACIGAVTAEKTLKIQGLPASVPGAGGGSAWEAPSVVEAELDALKESWQAPLRWA